MKFKRALVLILAVVMVLTYAPLSVFAGQADGEIIYQPQEMLNPLNFSGNEDVYGISEYDGMIPFESVSEYDNVIPFETFGESELPVYTAFVGDYLVPIYENFQYDSPVKFNSMQWHDVILTPATGGEAITRSFYNGNSTEAPCGALLLGDTPSGDYVMSYNETDIGILRIVLETDAIVFGFSGTQNYGGLPYIESSSSYTDEWIRTLFTDGNVPCQSSIYGNISDNYAISIDGNLYLSLFAVNIKTSDITGVKRGVKDVDFSVIPGGKNKIYASIYYLKIENETDWSHEESITVTVNGRDYHKQLNNYENLQYFLDISKIDKLELNIVPHNIKSGGSVPHEKINVKIVDGYFESESPSVIFESEAVLANGMYTLALPSDVYFFENNYVHICIYATETYPLEVVNLSQSNMLDMYLPSNDSGTQTASLKSTMEIRSSIDGVRFETAQYYHTGRNRVYNSNITFSLADAAFNPVPGVTVKKNAVMGTDLWGYLNERYYVFESEDDLTIDSVYYLRFGAFPLVKLVAKNSIGMGTPQSSYKHISGNTNQTALVNYWFGVWLPGINPNEWSVKLTNLVQGVSPQSVTYSVSAGTLKIERENNDSTVFYTDALIEPGVYAVEYYVGTEKVNESGYAAEFDWIDPKVLLVTPAKYEVRNAGLTYSYVNNYEVVKQFFVDIYAAKNESLPALTVSFYKSTNESFDLSNVKTISIPEATADARGHVSMKVPISNLKTAGITPGFYYIVVTDSQDNAVYTYAAIPITNRWLESETDALTLSGTVTLLGSSVSDVDAELWQGDIKLATTKIVSGTFSFSDLSKNIAYTVKIPAGRKWAAFEQSYTLSDSRSVQIALESVLPVYTVSGKVLANGQPVAGYVVSAYDQASGIQSAAAVTDTSGNYSLNVVEGTYILKGNSTADYQAYEGTAFTIEDEDITLDINLTLKPGIEGTVTLAGAPKADVYVYLYKNGSFVKSDITDAAGKYQFKDLAASSEYSLRISTDEYEANVTAVTAEEGKTTVNIALNSLVTLSGKVTLDGIAVNGVYVRLYANGNVWWSYTDNQGNYSFEKLQTGQSIEYTISVESGRGYNAFTKNLILSDNTVENIALAAVETHSIVFNIQGQVPGSTFEMYIHDNYGTFSLPSTNEINLAEGTYGYYYYYEGVYGSGNFNVTGDASVNIELPAINFISGTVVNAEGKAVADAEVRLSGVIGNWTAFTDSKGVYSFGVTSRSMANASVTSISLKVRHASEGYANAAAVYAKADLIVDAIILQTNKLIVNVKNTDGTAIPQAYVYLGSATSMSGYTNSEGVFTAYNTDNGSRYLYVYAYGYKSSYEEIVVAASGDTAINIELSADPNTQYTFAMAMTSSEITSGGFVSIVPSLKFTGSGTPAAGGKISLSLPDGLKVYGNNPYAGSGYSVIFGGDKTVKLSSVTVMIDGNVANLTKFNIYADFSADGISKSAYSNLTVVNATLSAPSIVESGRAFTVFGTAPSGSVVAIKDQDGNVLKTVAVSNKYFQTSVTIADDGDYILRAVSVKDLQTAASPGVSVKALSEAPPTVANIDITEGYLGGKPVNNTAYGFPTFSTYVRNYEPYEGQYRGIYNMSGSFLVNNLGAYEVKSVSFAGSTATDSGNNNAPSLTKNGDVYSFRFPIDTWSGLGVQPITVTLTKDGTDYPYTISLVTMLIDPSGYVYDAVTNERIEKAVVTLEMKQGNRWVVWIDPDGLQVNPQTADENGLFGWMVPIGEYRVLVTAEGYANAIANEPDGSYSPSGVIPVPPEQTEVNVALTYAKAPTVTGKWEDGKVVLTFSRPMETADVIANLTVKVGENKLEGTWSVSDQDRVFTFTPASVPVGGAVIRVNVSATSVSKDGIAIGNVTIADLTVPSTTPTQPSNPSTDSGDSSPVNASVSPNTVEVEIGNDLIITLSRGSYALENIRIGLYTLVKDRDYSVNNNQIIINASFLSKLATGQYTVIFEMSGGANPVLTVSVKRELWVNPFTDVGEAQWFYEYVKTANEVGLFVGTSDTTFEPNTTMTRAMFAQVLANLESVDLSEYTTSRFSDVVDGMWYTAPVEWAAEMGIVSGYGDGLFGPNDYITREQMAVMLNNYVQYKGITLPQSDVSDFDDEDEISNWAFEAVKAIQSASIISGKPGNLFDPLNVASRAEVATVFAKYIEIITKPIHLSNLMRINQ